MNFVATDTFGRQVKQLTPQNIRKLLLSVSESKSAHIYIHEPWMLVIHRMKEGAIWTTYVEELKDIDDGPLNSIYSVSFCDASLNEAIDLFLALLKSPRKDFEHNMRKKLGKFLVLKDEKGEAHEIFRSNATSGSVRERRRIATREREKDSHG